MYSIQFDELCSQTLVHFQTLASSQTRARHANDNMAAAVARFEGAMGIPKQPGVTHPTPGLLH